MHDSSLRLTRDQVREIDRQTIEDCGLPGIVLMENAGRGCAEIVLSPAAGGPVVVCCGKGNNGGDGFVIARHLDAAGAQVRVILIGRSDQLSGDAAINFHVIRKAGIAIQEFAAPTPAEMDAALAGAGAGAGWIVDALLGTGTRGEVREPFATAIEAINRSRARVLAVDLPSGLDCDSGRPLGPCICADHTVTFIAQKVGFDQPTAKPFLGEVHVTGIGVNTAKLLEQV